MSLSHHLSLSLSKHSPNNVTLLAFLVGDRLQEWTPDPQFEARRSQLKSIFYLLDNFDQFFSSRSQAINNKTLSSAKFFVMLIILLLTYMQAPGALRAGWVPGLLVELPVRDSVLIGLICVQMLRI